MKMGIIKKVLISGSMITILVSFKAHAADSLFIHINDSVNIIVATDGSGDYTTVQEAIDAIPDNNSVEKVIYIRNGNYKEKILIPSNKPHITMIGENVDSTILTYDDYSGRIVDGIEIGTSTSYGFAADANYFTAMNITFENSAGDVGQAVALRTHADKQSFLHCKLLGYQDTYYTWGRYRNYLKDCKIVGAIDYIFGATTVVFDSCQIHSLRESSYITAASTEEYANFGYVFFNCRLTAANKKTGIYLGRPWRPYAKTVFFECEEGEFIHQGGWSIWSGNENHTTCYYAEYNCFGPGSDTLYRVDWSHQLTDEEASLYTVENIFSTSTNPTNFTEDWMPDFEDNFFYKAVKKYYLKFMDSTFFNARLSELKYDGKILYEFTPEKYKYFIELPEGATEIPVLEVVPEDPRATYSVKYPLNLPGTSTVLVTAPDGGTFSSYSVFFSIDSAFANAFLQSLKYSHKSIPDFQPEVFEYAVELPYGTISLPTIQAVPQMDGATVEITRPEELPGEGIVVVTSADSIHQNIYTINFTIGPSSIDGNKFSYEFFITNPFNSTLDLSFNQLPAEYIKLFIYNLQGELVIERHFPAINSYSLETSWLQNGIYIYNLWIDGNLYAGKIVKTG